MANNIALSIKEITKLLQNSEFPSPQQSESSLSFHEHPKIKPNTNKMVSFIDIDEFQKTSISSGFKNSQTLSMTDRVQELEEENKELKEQLIQYKIKEHKWNIKEHEYQMEQKKLKSQNQQLLNKLRSITNQKESKNKKCSIEIEQMYFNTNTQVPSSLNKTQIEPKTVKVINVKAYCGVSGYKTSSPHRMYGDKKTDRTIQ